MALKIVSRAALEQRPTMRLNYKMWMGLNFLRLPIKDLHEEIRKQVETNPALADCRFELPPGWRPDRAASLAGDNAFAFEKLQAEETLFEHLSRELELSGAEGTLREKAIEIIGSLDENGRYTGDGLDAEGEKARALVMTLDPPGCGARTLAECYLAQLGKVPRHDREAARAVIAEIDQVLAGTAELKPDTRLLAAKLLACLDAKPGARYGAAKPGYIVPDILVDSQGRVTVEHGTIPTLKLSPAYVAMAGDDTLADDVRAYARDMVEHVQELQAAVAKRFETLELVAAAVVERQRDFVMRRGALKPLKMKEVAVAARCSVSTVSRAAERKYLRGPCGLVRLRDLFSAKDSAPLAKLQELLADPELRQLSDRQIADLMQAAGFKFARRTVNKYRKSLTQ